MIEEKTISQCINIIMSAGADYADIFAEKGRFYSSVSDDRKISTSVHDRRGVGLRAIKDHADYYITCDNCDHNLLLEKARHLASGLKLNRPEKSIILTDHGNTGNYNPRLDPALIPITDKIEMLQKAQSTAWSYSSKIKQATIRYSDFDREIIFANSIDQEIIHQKLALIEFLAIVYAGNGSGRQLGWAGKSFYSGWEILEGENSPNELVEKACQQAHLMLEAKDCPSGEMPVVFGPGPNGVLFHESCGHGMEADLVLKGSSFSGLMNEQVAADKVSICDSGQIPDFPGSYTYDDEGVSARKTTLIENGRLKNYLHSRITADKMNSELTGSGRRQSYRFPPTPRMRNTYIDNGTDDPEEIIRSTKKGLYAADVGFGGQVDVVTGRFITSIILGYMIEDGKLTYPVKGATITGLGIETLKNIDMVGNDLVLDPSPGRCGKSQDVPVGVGMPTLRVKKLIVGGTGSQLG